MVMCQGSPLGGSSTMPLPQMGMPLPQVGRQPLVVAEGDPAIVVAVGRLVAHRRPRRAGATRTIPCPSYALACEAGGH